MADAQQPVALRVGGYHPPFRQSWASSAGGVIEGCSRVVSRSGLCRGDEM